MITELYINGSLIDIDRGETIALTLTQFDLFNIAVRPSSYSNVFNVPKTQNNRLVFKSAGVVNSISNEAYQKLTCEIKVDGATVVSGTAELLSADGDVFRIAVKVASNDFFTQLKSLKLSDLSTYLEVLDHDYDFATVSARRDVETAIIYPNVDYGYFERADIAADQPFNFFFPALRLFYVFDSAFDFLGYTKRGSFFDGALYNSLAIMAKGIFDAGALYEAEYDVATGFASLVSRETNTNGQTYENATPLNFTEEQSDPDSLYQTTDIGKAYTTVLYNFAENFDVNDVLNGNLSATVRIEDSILQTIIDDSIEEGFIVLRLELWNTSTNTLVETIAESFTTFYNSLGLRTDIQTGLFSIAKTFGASVANNATDYGLLWVAELQTTTQSGQPTSTANFIPNIDIEATFKLEQRKPNQTDISVVNCFDDINIGSAFLALCNIGGLIPNVDEDTKTIELISFSDVVKNKSNALNWSDKLDLSEEPEVTFKIDGTAQNNLLQYANDSNDRFLKQRLNYGQGSLTIANTNLEDEQVKYQVPYSLCEIGNSFLGGSEVRQIARIDSGQKYVFDGLNYNLDPEAGVDGFDTRIVYLSRSTSNLIQVDLGTVVSGNYEVNNEALFFNNVIDENYGLIVSMFNKTKIVKALVKLNVADIALIDFSKPIYIDYFNDYFYVNEISQFKVNEVDSTQVTLIRM